MITEALLNQMLKLIEEARTNSENFRDAYEDNLRAIGETAGEYSLYEIELSEEYYLVMDFVDQELEDVSLVNRSHEVHISYNAGEELE